MSAHVGEDAALYALGLLDQAERNAIDAHARTCEACSQALAKAFDDVTAMVASEPSAPALAEPARRKLSPRWFTAIAAAIVLAVLPSAYLLQQNHAMHEAIVAQSEAMDRLASTPHRTASFAGMDARVYYGMDGSWYCIVVRGAKQPMQVAWMHDGTSTMLGTAVPSAGVAILYLPQSHRMDQLALVSNDRTMGQARLLF